jgi:hypothetical protein
MGEAEAGIINEYRHRYASVDIMYSCMDMQVHAS